MSKQFAQMRKTLEGRWKKEWSSQLSLSEVGRMFRLSLDAVANLGKQAADIRASGRLSEKGLTEELRALAVSQTVPVLKKASDIFSYADGEVRKKRAQLTIPPSDPNNAAQAIVRSEMRTWLRSLPNSQAVQLLLSEDVDERMLQAAFEAPAIMSGLTDHMRAQVFGEVTRRKFGPELDQVCVTEEAIAQGRAVLEICVYELRKELMFAGSDDAGFNSWMKEATAAGSSEEQSKTVEEISKDSGDAVDEIFARAFPRLYPDHPANQPLA